ncbi:MAG: tetratricopeptide repeat protein, partial [Geobacteraceae bacterium]|nr:tetratricopeptide repeat protein [Geobacteraceae bacterium]
MGSSNPLQIKAKLALADHAFDIGSFPDAYEHYCSVLSMSQDNPDALTGKALSLFHLGRYTEAVPALRQLFLLMPDSEHLVLLLAESLERTGEAEEAKYLLKTMLIRFPGNIVALSQLGRLCFEKGEYREARESFVALLHSDPENADALMYLGHILLKYQEFHEALAYFKKAYSLNPLSAQLAEQVAWLLRLIGAHHEALAWYRNVLDSHPHHAGLASGYLFQLNFCHGLMPEFVAAEHCRMASLYGCELTSCPLGTVNNSDKIRIGYVSGDLHTHSVSYFFEPILKYHDLNNFEVFCYSFGPMNDDTTGRLKSLVSRWRDVSTESPVWLSEQIREDGIQILVDLTGHSGGNRLGVFAARSAPVQISWL